MRFKLLRRRLTISSPRMAIRSAMPWPFRWAIFALVLGFSAAIGLWAFEFGKDIAAGYTNEITAREIDQILAQIAANLTPHGFIFTWTKSGTKYTLTTHHCPFHYLGQKHPEVCSINQALLESLTRQSLSHDTCIQKGDAVCTYTCEVKNGE